MDTKNSNIGVNQAVHELTERLIGAVNASGLPPSIVRLCLENLRWQVLDAERKAIIEETQKQETNETPSEEAETDSSNSKNDNF